MFDTIKKSFSEITETLFSSPKSPARTVSALWISLSVGALMLAGLLSIFIMLGRTPIIYEYFSNPHWFKRTLIVHVDLALLVWFYSFLCGLFVLIPSPKSKNRLSVIGYLSAFAGVLLITSSIFISSAQPVLSNYIPVLNHPLFITGLIFFGSGVGLALFNKRLLATKKSNKLPSILPVSALPGLQSAAVIFLISLTVFFIAWLKTPNKFHLANYYEYIIWGGGHLLQFVNIATVVVVWLVLLKKLTGQKPIPYKWSALLFTLFTVPVLASPLLLTNGPSSNLYLTGFTRFMQLGIFPVIGIFIVLLAVKLIRAQKADELPSNLFQNPRFNGLVISMLFIILSFVIGGFINGSNTIVPAHYHASLGGITIAFMVTVYQLMDYYDMPPPNNKVQKWSARQPLLFGLGQGIFVAGLTFAGAYGLARKVFGAQQQIDSAEVYIGLTLLFVGGSLAIAGGILFFWIVLKRYQNYRSKNNPHYNPMDQN